MKLYNITIDGSTWYRKYFWYIRIEICWWIFKIFPSEDGIFMEKCTIRGFKFRKYEKFFWLYQYMQECLIAKLAGESVSAEFINCK